METREKPPLLTDRAVREWLKTHKNQCQVAGCERRVVAYIYQCRWAVCNHHAALYAARKRQRGAA